MIIQSCPGYVTICRGVQDDGGDDDGDGNDNKQASN